MHMCPERRGEGGRYTHPQSSHRSLLQLIFLVVILGLGLGHAKQTLMCYKAHNFLRVICTTRHWDPCHKPEVFLIDRVTMWETKSFSWHLFPVIIYSQMQEGSVLKTRCKAASLLLEHDLFLCVFSCTCRLQQKTWAFTWICYLQEQRKPTEEWVGSVLCTQSPLSQSYSNSYSQKTSTYVKIAWLGCKFQVWSWLLPLFCCLEIKAEFSSEHLNFWFEHETEKYHPCIEPNLNVNAADKEKKS